MLTFCDVCNNMMYMMLDKAAGNALKLFCKNCGNARTSDADDAAAVVESSYMDDAALFRQYTNPNIKHDPTLPHVDHIKCPNAACTKRPDQSNDVIYAVFDKKNKKLAFHCSYCQHDWQVK